VLWGDISVAIHKIELFDHPITKMVPFEQKLTALLSSIFVFSLATANKSTNSHLYFRLYVAQTAQIDTI